MPGKWISLWTNRFANRCQGSDQYYDQSDTRTQETFLLWWMKCTLDNINIILPQIPTFIMPKESCSWGFNIRLYTFDPYLLWWRKCALEKNHTVSKYSSMFMQGNDWNFVMFLFIFLLLVQRKGKGHTGSKSKFSVILYFQQYVTFLTESQYEKWKH